MKELSKIIIAILFLSLINGNIRADYYPMDLETDFRLWVPTKIELSISEEDVTHDNTIGDTIGVSL